MDIDIIDPDAEEYRDLSPVQMAMVRAAQIKKNKLTAAAEEEKASFVRQLVVNRFSFGTVNPVHCAEIDAALQAEIDVVREDLLRQLAYESVGSEGNENGPYRYPENPNYNLTYPQRFLTVRQYYMDAVEDPDARLQAFAMDSLARAYLGEYYRTLYDLLLSYCN